MAQGKLASCCTLHLGQKTAEQNQPQMLAKIEFFHTHFPLLLLKVTCILSTFKRQLENIQKYFLFYMNAAVVFKEPSYKPWLHKPLGFQLNSITKSAMQEMQVALHATAITQYLLIIYHSHLLFLPDWLQMLKSAGIYFRAVGGEVGGGTNPSYLHDGRNQTVV